VRGDCRGGQRFLRFGKRSLRGAADVAMREVRLASQRSMAG
jgi:hypothetical protein